MENRIYKILMATGIPQLDNNFKADDCEILSIVDNKSSLYEEVDKYNPQIIIASDWLKGDGSLTQILADLKRFHQYIRIIYLAGELDLRNQNRIDELGSLVLAGIYDICISKEINFDLISQIVHFPKTEEDVSYLAKNILNNGKDFDKSDNSLGLSSIGNDSKGIMDNVFLFTSIKPGTGKSFLSVNTATAIAKFGALKPDGNPPSVVIVEADLQTLSIGTILNIKEDKTHSLKASLEAISTLFDRGSLVGNDSDQMVADRIIDNCLVSYENVPNLKVLAGSTMTPEEVKALDIRPEFYIYLIEHLRRNFDIVIIDTNSSMYHITTYPLLQKAKQCFYILNLDVNNIRNNLRYYSTLKSLGIANKIGWILNENIGSKQKGGKEKLEFTADDFEREYFKLLVRIPMVDKVVFLNRIYEGTPIVLDSDKIKYTSDIKKALLSLADNIYPLDTSKKSSKTKEKKSFKLFGKKH